MARHGTHTLLTSSTNHVWIALLSGEQNSTAWVVLLGLELWPVTWVTHPICDRPATALLRLAFQETPTLWAQKAITDKEVQKASSVPRQLRLSDMWTKHVICSTMMKLFDIKFTNEKHATALVSHLQCLSLLLNIAPKVVKEQMNHARIMDGLTTALLAYGLTMVSKTPQ